MKKILMFAAMICVFMACNKDEVKDVNRGKAIDFRIAVGTKADEFTGENLDKFMVTAFTDEGTTYFTDVEFEKPSDGIYFNSEESYYWPVSGDLHFVAYYPDMTTLGADVELSIAKDAMTLNNYTPAQDISQQKDIIVAKATGNKDSNEESGIAIEFAHQLSRIEVWADNNNESYVYSIKGVRIANAYPSGDLDFTNSSIWTEKGDKVTYEVMFDSVKENVTTSLNLLESVGGFAMLVPQNTVAWEKTTDDAGETVVTDGSYMAVLVQINTASGSRVYPSVTDDPDGDGFAWMASPMEFNWDPGYKYVYTLNFGKGGGITDPDTDDVENIFKGTIKFDVDVDYMNSYGFGHNM